MNKGVRHGCCSWGLLEGDEVPPHPVLCPEGGLLVSCLPCYPLQLDGRPTRAFVCMTVRLRSSTARVRLVLAWNAAAAAAAAPWSPNMISRRALTWTLGRLEVAWVIRRGRSTGKREGKSTGKAVPTAVRKTRNLLF